MGQSRPFRLGQVSASWVLTPGGFEHAVEIRPADQKLAPTGAGRRQRSLRDPQPDCGRVETQLSGDLGDGQPLTAPPARMRRCHG